MEVDSFGYLHSDALQEGSDTSSSGISVLAPNGCGVNKSAPSPSQKLSGSLSVDDKLPGAEKYVIGEPYSSQTEYKIEAQSPIVEYFRMALSSLSSHSSGVVLYSCHSGGDLPETCTKRLSAMTRIRWDRDRLAAVAESSLTKLAQAISALAYRDSTSGCSSASIMEVSAYAAL